MIQVRPSNLRRYNVFEMVLGLRWWTRLSRCTMLSILLEQDGSRQGRNRGSYENGYLSVPGMLDEKRGG